MAAPHQERHEQEGNDGPTLEAHQEICNTNIEGIACQAAHEEPPPAAKISCAIDELQDVFGTILRLRREKKPSSDQETTETCSDDSADQVAEESYVNQWTGVFDLFAFPRELRDRIYYHYVYRPQGLLYRRNTDRRFPFDDHPDEVASLFLTCRQVYHEAFHLFCRYNLIEFRSRLAYSRNRISNKGLAGVIRLFPDKPARHLQHLGVSAERYVYYTYRNYRTRQAANPTGAFAHMLHDAHVFKEHFPKLRDFTVSFRRYDGFFGIESRMWALEGEDEKEMIAKGVELMNVWLGMDTVSPPRWFRFSFDANFGYETLRTQEDIWNKAYARLVKERASRVEDVEESGKVWIEKQ